MSVAGQTPAAAILTTSYFELVGIAGGRTDRRALPCGATHRQHGTATGIFPRSHRDEVDDREHLCFLPRHAPLAPRGTGVCPLIRWQPCCCAGLLNAHGGAARGVLAEAFNLPPSTVASAVGRLERKGLVRRYRNPDDLRVSVVELTPGGVAMAKLASGAVDTVEESVESAASKEIRNGFDRMSYLLGAMEEEAGRRRS